MRRPSVSGYNRENDHFVASEFGLLVEWQPGTGTRYLMVARRLTEEEAGYIGCDPEALMTSIMLDRGWITFPLIDGTVHHMTYMAEKLKAHGVVSEEMVLAVTALVNLTLGSEAYGRTLFDELTTKFSGK